MTKLNKNMLERGGLMIEALAMLGLIAVVTPTMYKKSAERTLEVEDINTATTVRTYMNAVEAFMNNEYGTLMGQPELNADGQIADPNARRGFFYESADDVTIGRPIGSRDFHGQAGDPVLRLDLQQDLTPYLPYHFETNNPLYDYAQPEAVIVKNGNNLTAFVQFPARQGQADGIGQERTARIASLVGATGGYVLSDGQQARGVGGVWSLNNDNMNALFTNGAGNPYSLVTASANVAMDTNGGQLDNDKYLQRTREDDTDAEGDELWRNTMRTDLYMGGNLNEDSNETQNTNNQDNNTKHSIRSIQSMIVGAEKAPEVGRLNPDKTPALDANNHQIMDEVTNYGLYIYGTDGENYADAYIGGALQAVANELYVSTGRKIGEGAAPTEEGAPDERYGGAQFLFGRVSDDEYNTEIRGNGDIMNMGSQGWIYANLMSGNDHNRVTIGGDGGISMDYYSQNKTTSKKDEFHMALGETLLIGEYGKNSGSNPSDIENSYVSIFADESGAPWGYRSTTNAAGAEAQVTGSLIDNMYGTTSTENPETGETQTSSVAPNFPVAIGANTKVEGTLAAAQMDTNRLRAANLEAGSQKISDKHKWLRADSTGVFIRSPQAYYENNLYGAGPGMSIVQNGILMTSNRSRFVDGGAETTINGKGGGAYLMMKGTQGYNAVAEFGTQYIKDTTTDAGRNTRIRVNDSDVTGRYIDFIFENKIAGTGTTYDQNVQLRFNTPYSPTQPDENQIAMTANPNNGKKAGDLVIQSQKGAPKTDGTADPSKLRIRNSEVSVDMLGNDMIIQQADSSRRAKHKDATNKITTWQKDEFRTIFQGGHVVLNKANLKVYNESTKGGFFVRGNNAEDSGGDSSVGAIKNSYVDGEDAKYMAAMHGNILFTGAGMEKFGTGVGATGKDRSGVKYASFGAYDRDAAVNIIADDNATGDNTKYGSVLVIDKNMYSSNGGDFSIKSGAKLDPKKNNDYVGFDDVAYKADYQFRDGDTNKGLMGGAIYMRRGMMEILPDSYKANGKGNDADTGAGIVKAARFVANNNDYDTSGNPAYRVPVLVNDVAGTYEDDKYERYDTYMVNPAYTSVMHDIKLTTRGGARLSDILPDFINKGIYVANNTIKENANQRKMEFELSSGLTVKNFTDEASVDEPVSPFMGAVPAPQCPPGYGRVITVAPVSFEMSQAGTPKLSDMNGFSTFYAATDDPLPEKMKAGGKNNHSSTTQDSGLVDTKDNAAGDDGGVMSPSHELKYRELEWDPSDVTITANVSGGADAEETNKTIKDISYNNKGVVNISTLAAGKDSEGKPRRVKAYVLATATKDEDNVFKPLTFQQSTFLKTAAVPLVQGCKTLFGDGQAEINTKCGKDSYVRAWAVLMGFIYPEKYYKTIIDAMSPNVGIFANQGGTETFYWNIFPVLRDHLEAYATVYCYYDRTNLYKHNASTGVLYVDPYDHLHHPPTGYKKTNREDITEAEKNYLNRLNDPTLKYNETW